jgi:hypothetical protein
MGRWLGFPLEQGSTGHRRMIKEARETKEQETKQYEIAARIRWACAFEPKRVPSSRFAAPWAR